VESFQAPSVPEPVIKEIITPSYHRLKAKGKRDADLDGLPACIIEHRLSEEELTEKFPNGYKELPVDLFRNSIAAPALIASVINSKYVNALPLDRLSRFYRGNEINLVTNTMVTGLSKVLIIIFPLFMTACMNLSMTVMRHL